jgi:hypothetical protein
MAFITLRLLRIRVSLLPGYGTGGSFDYIAATLLRNSYTFMGAGDLSVALPHQDGVTSLPRGALMDGFTLSGKPEFRSVNLRQEGKFGPLHVQKMPL